MSINRKHTGVTRDAQQPIVRSAAILEIFSAPLRHIHRIQVVYQLRQVRIHFLLDTLETAKYSPRQIGFIDGDWPGGGEDVK